MNMITRLTLVLVVFACYFLAHAEVKGGKVESSTNDTPRMALTPAAQLVINKWRMESWRQSQTNKLYREYSYQSKVLGDEKVYTFAHVPIPGLRTGTFAGFVSVQKPAELRESREDKLSAGIRLDFPIR